MKALVYVGPNKVEYKDVPDPKSIPGYAKIKMKYCGICGGDKGIVAGKHPRAKAPLIVGHEFLGIIEEISKSNKQLKVGDRVVAYPLISCGNCLPCKTGKPHVCKNLKLLGIDVDGGMAEYAYVNENVLFKVDDNVSDIVASLIEPLAVIVRAIHQSGFKYLDSTVVMGAGPIGIIAAIALRNAGASKVVISDLDPFRLNVCKELGFKTVNVKEENLKEVIANMTNGDGVDVVFEASGTEAATFESTELAKINGTICMLGIHKAPHVSNLPQFSFKEQNMVATRVYTKHEFHQAVELVKELHNELEKIVSHIIHLSEGQTAFNYINDPKMNTIKVLLDCEK
ncbi:MULTISPECIES: zinc-dependent alcohol dehydrogenase [unclassified Sedimentibacter]|uniref:zinc-dependent alcohol dehydrogenase n=1 Tax=unclassified Sedimentibacter TaxID=2649220 RepID=UPI0027E1CFF2|nr:alcohol dehydrogenase catalytic domain-containing protein [Sedimentibacter sp. MB35-C1]WMJ77547.1 alcohol dehydrogenase catalytic domain-containing protein [Sedimentibacter sp. MB35-C1]